ncbi:hypothetical protein D3C85_1389970 [compost metagenome]
MDQVAGVLVEARAVVLAEAHAADVGEIDFEITNYKNTLYLNLETLWENLLSYVATGLKIGV